jgi:hypothetical protein
LTRAGHAAPTVRPVPGRPDLREKTPLTVLDRFVRAGFAEHVARRHLRYGRVRVDGVPTTDPATPAERPVSVTLRNGDLREIDTVSR